MSQLIESEKHLRTIKVIMQVFLGILILYLMNVLSGQLTPLFFALFFAILLQPIVHLFQRFLTIGWSIALTTILSVGIFFFIGVILFNAAQSLITNIDFLLDSITTDLRPLINSYTSPLGFTFKEGEIANGIAEMLQTSSFWSASGTFVSAVSGSAAKLLMTILYFAGLLGAITQYDNTINYLVDKKSPNREKVLDSFRKIKNSVSSYIKVKTLVSLVTGFLVGVISYFFGIEYALLWGFLAFALNYIPYLGSLIAIVPPLVLSVIQFDSISTTLILFVCLEGVQLVMGNIIEPKWMGDSFSINTVSVLFGFVFWAFLWGTAGMLLAVPLTYMFKVIFENMSSGQMMVRLMDKKTLEKGRPSKPA